MNTEEFLQACENGEHHKLATLQPSNEYPWGKGLLLACQTGQRDTVAFIVENHHPTIERVKDNALLHACDGGHVPIARYLLTLESLPDSPGKSANINTQGGMALMLACQGGHFDMVKFLLTSPDLPKHLSADNALALNSACLKGHMPIVAYLLTEPSLKVKANLFSMNNAILKKICHTNNLGLMEKIVLNTDIKNDRKLNSFLEAYPAMHQAVKSLFAMKSLQESLPNEESKARGKKIKV